MVLATTGDLAFRSRIDLSLSRAGISVVFVAAKKLEAAVVESRPALILVDYAELGEAELSALSKIKRNPATRSLPVLAYGPHLDLAGRDRAKTAGVDALLSNSQVAADLPSLIREWISRSRGGGS